VIQFTKEMREVVDGAAGRGFACVIATASADGEPGVGFKGSMVVLDDQSLAYWERSKRSILGHIEENPRVVVLAADTTQHVYLRFHGTSSIHTEGHTRDHVARRVPKAEFDRDHDGYAVVISVDKVTNLGGEVLQERNAPASLDGR
jgi:predicted pyridoxine 5'-phosphate oxidase superfamily flavin-nucleotide-binding protein